jgi:ABC-type bacteriocin/lantibiotic exporter with double-glycine peptidase domain
LILTAGWLLAIGQITLGQFVAAEVIVGALLLNFEAVVRRLYNVFFFLTALAELDHLFSLPKDTVQGGIGVSLPDLTDQGVWVMCKDLAFAYPDSPPPVFEHFNLEAVPGEKLAVFPHTSVGKSTLAKVLAGLYTPTAGVIRYNGIDLRDMDMDTINACRGMVLTAPLSLFEGTLEENITMGRPQIRYEDLLWAIRFVEMEEEVDALPLGLKTPIRSGGKTFPTSQVLRILIARAIVTRPQLLICEGTLHNMEQVTREVILRRLCSKEEPWSVIFISNDPTLAAYVDRRIFLD